MSPSASPVFEALPVEVLANILRNMASPEDVYSTIRASPKALGSFGSFREAILIEVLEAYLPAEIFAEFLGLLQIPKYEDFNYVPDRSDLQELDYELYDEDDDDQEWDLSDPKCPDWETCRYAAWPNIVNEFFETHFGNVNAARSSGVQRQSTPQPADKKHINYIASMYGTLKRFIRDYESVVLSIRGRMLPALSNLEPSFRRREVSKPLPEEWPPLSDGETLRLQRGFLRYELCSRLNAIPNWHTYMIQWKKDEIDYPFGSLTFYLQRWEEEEIRCVWTYVHGQYQVLVREIVDEFRCDVRRLSKKARHMPDNEVIQAPDISTEIHYDFFGRWAYNMSCLGLPMLQQLLRSGSENQRRFLKNTTFERLPPFEGALFLRDKNSMSNRGFSFSMSRNLPTTTGANPIYKPISIEIASWPCFGDQWMKVDAAEKGLQQIGWVFWEEYGRMEYLQLLHWDARQEYGAEKPRETIFNQLRYSGWRDMFAAENDYPEKYMYVAKEDHRGELSAKYAADPPTPGGELLFRDRLRDISDWSSKEVSPAFSEICQGPPLGG